MEQEPEGLHDGPADRRRSHGPTIYDVARVAGVAPSTVSRAFSRPGRVNPETAAHIHTVAESLGYRASAVRTSPVSMASKTVALVVSDITNPVYFAVIRGAEEVASRAGLTMVLSDFQESPELERTVLDRTIGQVEGVVLATSRMSDSAVRTIAQRVPLILLNRTVSGVTCVVTDNADGMHKAVDHLAELGHRSICYLAGPEASWADGTRWQALRNRAASFDMRVRRIGPLTPTVRGATPAIEQFIEHPTSSVIAYNDLLAIGFMKGLVAQGIPVPGDISVVGFDNSYGSDLVTPGLTTVAAPLRGLGVTAMQLLLDRIGGAPPELRTTLLPTRLAIRESTAQARR